MYGDYVIIVFDSSVWHWHGGSLGIFYKSVWSILGWGSRNSQRGGPFNIHSPFIFICFCFVCYWLRKGKQKVSSELVMCQLGYMKQADKAATASVQLGAYMWNAEKKKLIWRGRCKFPLPQFLCHGTTIESAINIVVTDGCIFSRWRWRQLVIGRPKLFKSYFLVCFTAALN